MIPRRVDVCARAILSAGFCRHVSDGLFTGSLNPVKREQLEHIIRAAGVIAETQELIILGSQAILGSHPDAPEDLLVSQEVDTYPLEDPGPDHCLGRAPGRIVATGT